jgi:uncharacterized membrane protein
MISVIDEPLSLGILALAALAVAIVALIKLTALKARIEELEGRLPKPQRREETPTSQPIATKPAVPPPLPAFVTQPQSATSTSSTRPVVPATPHHAFNWESILGVKLFAWIGGFALFLGVVFFVKYAFENNWITPTMRIIAGAIIGVALIIVSLLPKIRRYRIPAQSVCATGILILYADAYSAHAYYGLISLTATIALLWIVTGVALVLANFLAAHVVAWLALVGGFMTPFLLQTGYANAILLVTYIAVLDCAVAAVAGLKQWNYLLPSAAFLSIVTTSAWMAGVFTDPVVPTESHILFLVIEGLFLGLCTAVTWRRELNNWTIAAMAVAGWGALIALMRGPTMAETHDWLPAILLAGAGLIAFAIIYRGFDDKAPAMAVLVSLALALTALAEVIWRYNVLNALDPKITVNINAASEDAHNLGLLILRHVAIFLLFAAIPYLVGTKRLWPWMLAAVAGPLQFLFAHEYMRMRVVPDNWLWLPTLAFAIPAAIGLCYLVKREHVDLASGDSRLATQGAAVLAFISFVFPVQFHREWITLGWAIEGLLLILLYRWIPNRRLRVVALIVLAGAFVRLALNPAVLEYHKRAQIPIWNWYLYAYGIAAVCLFLSARWFGEPKEKQYERAASPLLYSLAGIVLFLLMNIEIADYFSIGPTLTFSFSGNFARDMTYTIAWSLFAFCLLVLGIARNVRAVRLVGIGLLLLTFAKLFLHDLDSLKQLYRIGAFIAVAVIAIVASFVYQRFLLPRTKA